MPIPRYLAITGGEFFSAEQLPDKIAWMACHYSCYGNGLSNLPQELPEGSLIIFNDRMPPDRHDATQILEQLEQLGERCKPAGFLLDFQRSGFPLNRQVAKLLTEKLSFPTGVSDLYAAELDCPVFLSAPPPHLPLLKHLAPWANRKIWLEIALQTQSYTLTTDGCRIADVPQAPLPEPVFTDPLSFCRYHLELSDSQAIFTLQRSEEEIDALLQTAEGIDLAVGLYQQLGSFL